MALTPLDTDRAGGKPQTTTDVPTSMDDESDRLSKDLIFGLLSNRRRRRVLTYLAENGRETTLSNLAEHLASIENDKPVAVITSDERKRVYVGLYQVHLPKMDDADVIDYNQARGTIELRSEASQLLTYISPDRPASNRTDSLPQQLLPVPLLALWKKFMPSRKHEK